MTEPGQDLDALEQIVVLGELEQLVMAAEKASGIVPVTATRPLFPWEVKACTDFAAISTALGRAQSQTQLSLDTARDAIVAALAAAIEQADNPQDAAAALAAFAATQPPAVRAALAEATDRILAALDDLYSSGADLLIREAATQGVAAAGGLLGEIRAAVNRFAPEAGVAPSWLWTRIVGAAVADGGVRVSTPTAVIDAASAVPISGAYDLARQATNVVAGQGRADAAAELPTPLSVYASELLDGATCDSCLAMDGTEFVTTEQAYESYPDAGPYVNCDGGDRCRGTLVFVYEELDPSSAPATGDTGD